MNYQLYKSFEVLVCLGANLTGFDHADKIQKCGVQWVTCWNAHSMQPYVYVDRCNV